MFMFNHICCRTEILYIVRMNKSTLINVVLQTEHMSCVHEGLSAFQQNISYNRRTHFIRACTIPIMLNLSLDSLKVNANKKRIRYTRHSVKITHCQRRLSRDR